MVNKSTTFNLREEFPDLVDEEMGATQKLPKMLMTPLLGEKRSRTFSETIDDASTDSSKGGSCDVTPR